MYLAIAWASARNSAIGVETRRKRSARGLEVLVALPAEPIA
jgi:hypothetical protein